MRGSSNLPIPLKPAEIFFILPVAAVSVWFLTTPYYYLSLLPSLLLLGLLGLSHRPQIGYYLIFASMLLFGLPLVPYWFFSDSRLIRKVFTRTRIIPTSILRKGRQLRRYARNSYLEILVGTGLPGFALFLAINV